MNSCILFLLLFFFINGISAFDVCPGPNSTPSGKIEKNAAEIYPNDEAVLSEDGKIFITYKYVPDKRVNHIDTCAAYTCGRKTFHMELILKFDKPLMSCEQHRCLNPDKIKCRKTIEYGACAGENEYVAGFIVRNNGTNEWLEVECCGYDENLNSAFVKNFAISSSLSYQHEIIIENGTMVATDYVKDIKKTIDIFGKTILSVSIYRMKCDISNFPQNVSSVFDKRETLIDADGTGKFENDIKTCETLTLGFGLLSNDPFFDCVPDKCINNEKIICQNNVKVEACVGNNKWVAGFGKDMNGTYDMSIVQCCEYNDTTVASLKFKEFQTFNISTVTVDNTVQEFGIPLKMSFVNNITAVDEINGTTIYSASVFSLPCSNTADQIKLAQERLQQGTIQTLFRDLMNRASKKAMKDQAADIPQGFEPLIQAQQNSLLDAFSFFAANAAAAKVQNENVGTKNETEIKEPTRKMLLKPNMKFTKP